MSTYTGSLVVGQLGDVKRFKLKEGRSRLRMLCLCPDCYLVRWLTLSHGMWREVVCTRCRALQKLVNGGLLSPEGIFIRKTMLLTEELEGDIPSSQSIIQPLDSTRHD